VLVNSAGADARSFGAPADASGPLDLDAKVFAAVLEADSTGPMLVSRHLLPLLRGGHDPMLISSQLAARIDAGGVVMLHPGWISTDMGGPDAPLDLDETSTTIASTSASAIASLTLADTGRIVRWDGHDHP